MGLQHSHFVFLASLFETRWLGVGEQIVNGVDFLSNVEV